MIAPTVSVVMPAFNEAEILAESVREVRAGLVDRELSHEILVVENGSTDETATIADALSAEHETVRVEHLDRADYGEALRHGLLTVGGSIVVNFDVDYYDLAFFDVAIDRMTGDDAPSILVASKRAPGSNDERSLPRRVITATFSAILRVGFGLGVSDTHGMKAMRRADVVEIARRCRFGEDLFDTELILRAERAGRAVEEVPASVTELRPARTSMVRRMPRATAGLVKLRVALARERT